MNPFGEVLLDLMEDRGLSMADLAERISQMPEGSELSEEELLDAMMAAPGEEVGRLVNAFDAALLYEY
jgi:hypothetical protein